MSIMGEILRNKWIHDFYMVMKIDGTRVFFGKQNRIGTDMPRVKRFGTLLS